MLIVTSVIAVGIVAGVLAFAFAFRWPSATTAPAVAPETLAQGIHRHRNLARFLRGRRDPSRLAGFALTAAAAGAALAGLGIGVLLAMARSNRGLARWDRHFAVVGADHATAFSTDVLRTVSWGGGTAGAIVLSLAAAALAYRRTPTRAVPLFLTLVVGGQFALSNLIKAIVHRARPDLRPLTGFSGTSFPSGHSTAAAATFLAIALLLGRHRSRTGRAVLAGIAVGLAVMVAATRVLLGVHWFTDVLAGLLLGWGWFAVCSILFGGRILRFGLPVAQAELVADLDPAVAAR